MIFSTTQSTNPRIPVLILAGWFDAISDIGGSKGVLEPLDRCLHIPSGFVAHVVQSKTGDDFLRVYCRQAG